MWTSLLSIILVINELMASNTGKVISPAINFDSWIELYNPSDQAVDLGGLYLSDNAEDLKKWKMPSSIGTVPAKGFKVIWLGSNDIKDIQAPFKLDCDGGTVYLSDKSGELITSQDYPEALSRTSWARKTDGGEEWGWTDDATPEASNATARFASSRLAAPVPDTDSKMFTSSLTVKVNIPEGAKLMYTTDGSLPISLENVSPWTEYVKNGNCEGSDASCFVCRDGNSKSDVKRITDGVGVDGSRGVTVHSVANAAQDYTTQFFVYTPDHIWKTGEKYRFHMKVRADKAATIDVQAHKTPGDWTANGMLKGSYQVGTEWTEISYEGTVKADQTEQQEGWGWWTTTTYKLQTIAFNLNKNKSSDNDFYFDEISWESMDNDITSQESTTGEFKLTETTNLTFRLFRDGYLPSVPVTRSYIKNTNNYTLPVISIVGDKKFFTDPKIGFDCEGDGTNGKTGNGQNSPKNYNCDWDRPANFSYLSSDGKMLFNQDVNIAASGGYTRSQQFRSFKLKANKIFDGQNRFDYPFFPMKPYNRNKVLLIRNGGNDIWRHNARFIDPALETIIQRSGLDVDVQSYVPVIEYVNGQLRGVFNMREPNNDKFADANWGYDDEELDAFENLVMKNGDDEAIKRIFELGKNASDAAAYKELKTLLDIDEFTNYMAVTLFLYNDDWPDNNIKAYRSRNDGRYRFVSYDLDYAFKGCWKDGQGKSLDNPFKNFERFKDDKTAPRTSYNKDIVNLFLNLLNNDEYRQKFINTFCIVAGSVFEPTRANAIVDELLNNVKDMCKLMRNNGINDGHEPQNAATTIKNELKNRSDKFTNYMKQFTPMQLGSVSRQTVTLNVDTEGAQIFINDVAVPTGNVSMVNGQWSLFDGHLFAPVELTAKAPAGYRFAGWKKGSADYSDAETIDLPGDATVKLTATFTRLSDDEYKTQGITPVCINEVGAANGIYVNEYFKRNDWVELYNTTDAPIDVEGMYLSDNRDNPKKYQISKDDSQASTIIPAHDYLVVWCDKLEPKSQLHASFKLSAEGDTLLLTAADESWTDMFVYQEQKSDETTGRYPDGSNNIVSMNIPTIGRANMTSSYTYENDYTGIRDLTVETAAATLSIRYAAGNLFIESTVDDELEVRIVTLAGQSVATLPARLSGGRAEVSVAQLPAGVFMAHITDSKGHKAVCKFIKH